MKVLHFIQLLKHLKKHCYVNVNLNAIGSQRGRRILFYSIETYRIIDKPIFV